MSRQRQPPDSTGTTETLVGKDAGQEDSRCDKEQYGPDLSVPPSAGGTPKIAQDINVKSTKTFKAVTNYIQAELLAPTKDVELLERMNRLAAEKYDKMSQQTQAMISQAISIQKSHKEVEHNLNEINQIFSAIEQLEVMAEELNRFSIKL
ncbi:hypothetical protein EV182_005342, partial [Spiromyces aspiralis]